MGGRRTDIPLVALLLAALASLLGPRGSRARPHPGLSPQGHLHDRYGQLVNIYTKLLLTKISFHLKVASSGESGVLPPAPPPRHQGRRGGGCRTLQTDGREVRRPRGGSQRGALAGPRILSTSGSAGSARGGWWLHRLGGGGCCSSPSLPQRLEAALGQSRGGLRLHEGVLSTAPAVSCGPGGDRRGAGEGGWDRCQQHVSPPAPPWWGSCPVPGPKVTGAQKMRLKLKGWAHVELGVLAEGPPSGYHARV